MPSSAGAAAAEIEGPRYVLAHQASWAALITFGPALDFQKSCSGACMRVVTMKQQLWGLQEGFYLGMTALGLAGELPTEQWHLSGFSFMDFLGFLDFPGFSFQTVAALGLARGFSLAVNWGHCRSTKGQPRGPHTAQLHFLLLAHDLNVSMFRLQAFQGTV